MERTTRRYPEGAVALNCSENKALARLAAYEDTGLEPEEIDRMVADLNYARAGYEKYYQAEQEGRLVALPFVAMVEQSLQNGKMTPAQDQQFNGRFAVVYSATEGWECPLIDICGGHYDREQADKRMAALAERERGSE